MSLVLAVATKNFAVLKSDGRGISSVTGKITSEDIHKLSLVGKHCVIGYTGIGEAVSRIINKATLLCNERGYTPDTITATVLSEICRETMESEREYIYSFDGSSVNLVIAGVEDNAIIAKAIGYGTDLKLMDFTPKPHQEFLCCSLASPRAKHAKKFQDFPSSMKHLLEDMDRYIKYIASVDDSVNTNIATVLVDRQQGVMIPGKPLPMISLS